MNIEALLNSDMTTISRTLWSGFDWWRGELSAMLPARLRRTRGAIRHFALYDAKGGFSEYRHGDVRRVEAAGVISPRPMPVVIADDLCLVRTIQLPALGEADLARLVMLDADRIMPMPAASLLLATSIADRPVGSGTMTVMVAGLPCKTAEAMLAAAAVHGIAVSRVGMIGDAVPGHMRFDFTPAMRAAGLLEPTQSAAAIWWAILGFLFAFNIGLLVWRDAQSVNRLEALVAQQAPSVNAARSIIRRIDDTQRVAVQLAARRRDQDALAIVADVTNALPPRAWVQRFEWNGRSLNLAGYKREGVDVIGGLRRVPRFIDVRATNADMIAELPTGQPFSVTATVRSDTR